MPEYTLTLFRVLLYIYSIKIPSLCFSARELIWVTASQITAIFLILWNLTFKCYAPNYVLANASINHISEHSREDRLRLRRVSLGFGLVHSSSNAIMISLDVRQ